MNKNIIIAVGIVIFLAGGGFFVVNQQSQNAAMEQEKVEKKMMSREVGSASGGGKKQESKEGDAMIGDKASSSRYVVYSKSVLDKSLDKRRVLYFYASWCPVCRPANADFEKNADKIPEDLVVIRVNYNDPDTDQEEKDLAKKYGITYQHTFVQIDGQGKEVTRWSGGQTDELLANSK